MSVNQLKLSDFSYDLPEDRIAPYPLAKRDQSKLLTYNKGNIAHRQFNDLPDFLPENSLLVFNDTRVIPARIVVHKESGARIEVFLLAPKIPNEIEQAMRVKAKTIWQCMVGNKKRWREGDVLSVQLTDGVSVTLKWHDRDKDLINIKWDSEHSFAALLELWGKTPLPPYIKRDVDAGDKNRYQTVYASNAGAVAAPTAGLHFTDEILQKLQKKGHTQDFVTLHVGAGTFKPVTVDDVVHHDMHAEPFQINRSILERICNHDGPVIPVGTTAMRVLESLYWLGVQAINGTYNQDAPFVDKLEPYEQRAPWDCHAAFVALADLMGENLVARTRIMIMPSYEFRLCNGLITNFHLPKSTLLMLIAAFIGDDWKNVYDAAMNNEYRFLSYGDSSLLLP